MTYFAASVLSGGMEFGSFTHSVAGVFTVDVLIAWALTGLWLLVREPLVALLPRARQGPPAALLRCGAPRTRVRPSTVAWWYLSAALGALTHVVWDAFTHHDRWGVRLLPVLGRELRGSPVYWYLQYGSSVVGAAVAVAFVVRALRRAPATAEPAGLAVLSVRDRYGAAAVVGGCALLGAVQRVTRWWEDRRSGARTYEVIPTLCFGVGAGLVLGVVLYAAGIRLWRPAGASDTRGEAERERSGSSPR
jgi:hypothetical protein